MPHLELAPGQCEGGESVKITLGEKKNKTEPNNVKYSIKTRKTRITQRAKENVLRQSESESSACFIQRTDRGMLFRNAVSTARGCTSFIIKPDARPALKIRQPSARMPRRMPVVPPQQTTSTRWFAFIIYVFSQSFMKLLL